MLSKFTKVDHICHMFAKCSPNARQMLPNVAKNVELLLNVSESLTRLEIFDRMCCQNGDTFLKFAKIKMGTIALIPFPQSR